MEKHYDNPHYYVLLVIFQTYKNVVLRGVHYDATFCPSTLGYTR